MLDECDIILFLSNSYLLLQQAPQRCLPLSTVGCAGFSSLLESITITSRRFTVEVKFLTHIKSKRMTELGHILSSFSVIIEVGKGGITIGSNFIPCAGFLPALGVGSIAIKFVGDKLGVVCFDVSVSFGWKGEWESIVSKGVFKGRSS